MTRKLNCYPIGCFVIAGQAYTMDGPTSDGWEGTYTVVGRCPYSNDYHLIKGKVDAKGLDGSDADVTINAARLSVSVFG